MLRFPNVATPDTAATVAVPDGVPPFGCVPMLIVTLPVNPVAVFPDPSLAVTCTAGAIATPATELVGDCVNTSCVICEGVTANAVEAAVRVPVPNWSVYPVPVLSTLKSPNVATPATAAT